MKMPKATYVAIRDLCQEVMGRTGMTKEGMIERMKKRPTVKDPVKAARWELLHRASDLHSLSQPGDYFRGGVILQDAYAQGLNDDHIDTALRSIWRELGTPELPMQRVGYPHCVSCKKVIEDCGCDGYQGSYIPGAA